MGNVLPLHRIKTNQRFRERRDAQWTRQEDMRAYTRKMGREMEESNYI